MFAVDLKSVRSWRGLSVVIALTVPVLVIVVSLAVIPVYFPTNDDSFAQQIFAGSISGEPSPYVTFIGYAWCWLVSGIFAAVPGIPWWTILHFLTIYASLLVLGLVSLRAFDRLGRSLSPIRSFCLLFAIECGIAMPLIGRLQFTTTGSLAASVAVYAGVVDLLLQAIIPALCVGEEEERYSYSPIIARPIPVLLMALGFSYRSNCGYLALGFWLLALAGIMFTTKRSLGFRFVRSALTQFICASIVVLALLAVNTAAYSSPEWRSALERGNAYAGFTDFPTTPYQEAPDFYNEVGWDEDLYNIASDYWFFLDPRMTTDSLASINSANARGMHGLIEHPLDSLRDRLMEMREPVPLAYAMVCCAIAVVLFLHVREWRWRLSMMSVVVSVGLLLGYLFLKGRLPLRAYLSVMLPALAVLGAFFLVLLNVLRSPKQLPRVSQWVFVALLTVVALLPAIAAFCQFGYVSEDCQEQLSRQDNIDSFQEYASQHPDALFIYDYWAELTPQTVWDVDWPSNVTQWGGWTYIMPWFDDVMREQGFGGTPTTDTLLRDDVYFVNKDDYTRDLLIADMQSLYGEDVTIEQVDTIGDGLRVYRFTLA